MDTSMILASVGDQRAFDLVTGMLAARVPLEVIASELFELAAEHDGEFLDDVVAIVAEATGDADPRWAFEAIRLRIGMLDCVLTGSGADNVSTEWGGEHHATTITVTLPSLV